MGLKRTKKRKTREPQSKVPDFGFGKTLRKIERAVTLLDKKSK